MSLGTSIGVSLVRTPLSYFKIVFSVLEQFLVENTSRRKEEDGNAIREDRPEEEVRYRRWCQKEHNEDGSVIMIVARIQEPGFRNSGKMKCKNPYIFTIN